MSKNMHDDQQFGVFGLSNDEGAARKRASLVADFEAKVATQRAALVVEQQEIATAEQDSDADASECVRKAVTTNAPQDVKTLEAETADVALQEVEERVFSERVAYADVRHMSKNFYKGLIASAAVVLVVVIAIIILGRMVTL